MQVKIRETCKSEYRRSTFGLTVPNEVAIFFKECFFSVEKSGCSIIFTSGCNQQPTKEQIKNFKLEDCKI